MDINSGDPFPFLSRPEKECEEDSLVNAELGCGGAFDAFVAQGFEARI